MCIKRAFRIHLIPVRMGSFNNTRDRQLMLTRMLTKENIPPMLLGMQTCIATMETNMTVPQIIGNLKTQINHSASLNVVRPNNLLEISGTIRCGFIGLGYGQVKSIS